MIMFMEHDGYKKQRVIGMELFVCIPIFILEFDFKGTISKNMYNKLSI